MRNITEIIVHCTATPAGRNVTVNEIDRWHRQRGFRCIGYHYVVMLDGRVCLGRDVRQPGAHTKGHNSCSIGVCYVGGLDSAGRPADTRTEAQRRSLRELITSLRLSYPGATVHGHREFAVKACPCFDASAEYN